MLWLVRTWWWWRHRWNVRWFTCTVLCVFWGLSKRVLVIAHWHPGAVDLALSGDTTGGLWYAYVPTYTMQACIIRNFSITWKHTNIERIHVYQNIFGLGLKIHLIDLIMHSVKGRWIFRTIDTTDLYLLVSEDVNLIKLTSCLPSCEC